MRLRGTAASPSDVCRMLMLWRVVCMMPTTLVLHNMPTGKKSRCGSSAEPGASSDVPQAKMTVAMALSKLRPFVPVREKHHIVSKPCACPATATATPQVQQLGNIAVHGSR
jgi:hypothetical protein